MALHYTRRDILDLMEQASGNIQTFYAQPFTNMQGVTADTGEPYADLVAGWCLDHWPLFENIPVITRELPYRDPLRDGTRPRRLSLAEELLSRDLYTEYHPGTGRKLNIIGQILDYQMPLKNKPSDPAGKIDLVAWDGDELRLLKLRTQGSTDSMLRCLLETYTNFRTVDKTKLLDDLGLPSETEISASPFVYRDGHQKAELTQHAASLHRLIWVSGCRPIYYIP